MVEAVDAARERVLGALLLRRERGVAMPFGVRDWSSGLGEEERSCARGGGAITSLREAVEVAEADWSLLPEEAPRKTCAIPLAVPVPRRPLSRGLIGILDGRTVIWESLSTSP